jgi:shikimate 5-dehydrogenase
MFDGMGYVEALKSKGCNPEGQRALLVGAGGAGSAIAYSLMTAGVAELALHDEDHARRDSLAGRLAGLELGKVSIGSPDPRGFGIVINATPIGMKPDDPHPVVSGHFTPDQFVGCVITVPAVPPMIAVARGVGCNTMTGAEMIVQILADEGVDVLFGYSGGAILPTYDAVFVHNADASRRPMPLIVPANEQGAGFMAAGYARATGRVGVCVVTSGPGATNTITPVRDSMADSVPMVVI